MSQLDAHPAELAWPLATTRPAGTARRRAREDERRPPRPAWPLAKGVMVALLLAGCAKSSKEELKELRDAACACKSKECAIALGKQLSSLAARSPLDEADGRLAMEASNCLAAFGE